MNGPNVPLEMFASHKALSTPVHVAGIVSYALFGLVPAGGVDWLSVQGRGDLAPPRLFGEVGNRDGDFGHGAGCAAGGTGRERVGVRRGRGARCGEGGGVDAHGGREKVRVGRPGEVKVAVHV